MLASEYIKRSCDPWYKDKYALVEKFIEKEGDFEVNDAGNYNVNFSFQKSFNVSTLGILIQVLDGNHEHIGSLFIWSGTPQGRHYWFHRSRGTEELSEQDKEWLRGFFPDTIPKDKGLEDDF